MNGYSKIRAFTPSKSRSIDFSDLSLSPPAKTQQPQKKQESFREADEDGGEAFGVILSRNCSLSSSSSQRFKPENSGALQSAVKRAFSMRRSSSVSEGYCRIHDQWGPPSPPQADAVDLQMRSRKKRSRILKACKRLFGIS